jgi:hypothetical protein
MNVGIFEAAHDLDDGIHLADVTEELVAESFALRGAPDQAGDIDELEGGGDLGGDLGDGGELRETWIRDADDAEVGFDGAKGIVFGWGLMGTGESVEEGGFPNVWKTNDTGFKHVTGVGLRSEALTIKSYSNVWIEGTVEP